MKISLRRAAALQNRINETIRSIKIVPTTGLNEFQSFTDVVDGGNKELLTNDGRRKDLLVALFAIRTAVGAANYNHGIDGRLAKAAYIDKRIQQLSELVEVQPRESLDVITGRVAKLAGQETSQRLRLYGEFDEVKVSLVTAAEIKAFKQEVMELKKLKQTVNDEILELNIKTEIELDDSTVAFLRAEDLV
jgi:hypothetical protein